MQVKLLRAMQERAVRPVGAHAEEPVDVRILSASHRDLGQLVAEGKFRQDLYFRINVITLRLPPLRERPEDIPQLAEHTLARRAERDGVPPHRLAPDAVAELQRHPFPGNVLELENLLERACALCDGDEIQAMDLSLNPTEGIYQPMQMFNVTGDLHDLDHDNEPDDDDERLQVLRMLDETRWNRSEAARRLGMTLRQLRYRLQKWGME